MIPTIILLIAFTIFFFMEKNTNLDFRSELVVISVHILMIAFYGYYSRRLTFPITIFLLLVILKMFYALRGNARSKILELGMPAAVLYIFISWAFTLGPLV